jgi:hypothetical protein
MKPIKQKKRVTVIVLCGIVILLGIGYYSGFFFFSGLTPCFPPPGMAVDGIARGTIYTWIDSDGNGKNEPGEQPLPNVEIKYPASTNNSFTGLDGKAEAFIFKPGCACKCWKYEYVEVVTPHGYRPTTPTRKDMAGENLVYEFGFIRIDQ